MVFLQLIRTPSISVALLKTIWMILIFHRY